MTNSVTNEDHCSRWSGIPQPKQTEFTRRAVGLLVTAFRTGVYNLPVLWKRVDWRYGNGVSFILGNRLALASWDFNQLTRLVIGAHDECIRVEVEPHGFGYLKINMWPRKGRDGQMSERHPSIEDAISDYRTDNPPPSSISVGYQDRVAAAHHALFHDDPTDIAERNARGFEESVETAQAFGMTEDEAIALVRYTFSRPVGDPAKEIGAKILTTFSLGVVAGIDVMAAAEADLEKLQQPETVARIRAKRTTRHGRGPLPGFDPSVIAGEDK